MRSGNRGGAYGAAGRTASAVYVHDDCLGDDAGARICSAAGEVAVQLYTDSSALVMRMTPDEAEAWADEIKRSARRARAKAGLS